MGVKGLLSQQGMDIYCMSTTLRLLEGLCRSGPLVLTSTDRILQLKIEVKEETRKNLETGVTLISKTTKPQRDTTGNIYLTKIKIKILKRWMDSLENK